jgi:hypothetical protein
LGLGLEHWPQPVAIAIEHLRHGAGRGQNLLGKTQGAQLLEGLSRGQAGIVEGGAEGRVWLGMGLCQRVQSRGWLGMALLASRLLPQ